MRLLLSIPYFSPAYAFGGSVTVAETMVTDFLAAGHDVTVATTDVFDATQRVSPDAAQLPEGAEIARFPNINHRLAAGFNAYTPRGLRGWLARNLPRFDVVLLHDFYSMVSVLTARAAVRADVPFALQPLGTLTPARASGRPLVKQAFLRAWGRTTVRTASAILYLAEHEAADALKVGAVSEQLIYMPLPLELPAEADADEAPEPTIAFVGRLHPVKRVDLLLQATAIVRRKISDVRLEIVGPGGRFQKDLETLTRRLDLDDAVVFHGYVSTAKKFEVLRRAHISALLSSSEGLPMSVLEAMACFKPAVLSRGCHLDELDGRACLVVPDDPREVAAGMVRLLEDESLRRRLGTGAAAFAHEFRREVVMPKMIDVVGELAARTTGRVRESSPRPAS